MDITREIQHRNQTFRARAVLLGDRIDLNAWRAVDQLASNPLTIAVRGGGTAVLFRYGVVVLFDITGPEEVAFLEQLRPFIGGPYATPETESIDVQIDPGAREGMGEKTLLIADGSVERTQVIADILSKSVMLAWYEARIAASFERIEPLASELQQTGSIGARAKDLLRHIGTMLLSEHLVVGRIEVGEKPELLWERPDLEGLFIRLEDEYEIKERHASLGRKLNLISHTAQTLLQLQQSRHSLRLELYIVILIVIEILLTLYQLFFKHA